MIKFLITFIISVLAGLTVIYLDIGIRIAYKWVSKKINEFIKKGDN